MDMFELRPLIVNFNCKLSTISSTANERQLLCLVNKENEILLLLRSSNTIKLISYFKKKEMEIQDVCFDPSSHFLMVICFDNTLSIVPCAVVDKSLPTEIKMPSLFSTTHVTSYIIPFVGPHECPDSKKCPNRSSNNILTQQSDFGKERAIDASNILQVHCDELLSGTDFQDITDSQDVPVDLTSIHRPKKSTNKSHAPFIPSNICPYPLSVAWWRTADLQNRAIIGYSDGSICFVGLSPNCPFIASTAIESGSVVKLLICKDNTFESVMLLITSSLKVQYKLLLEQNAIKYTYPGDISPSTAQARENDWQIIMPVNLVEEEFDKVKDENLDKPLNETATSVSDTDTIMNHVAPPIIAKAKQGEQQFTFAGNFSNQMLSLTPNYKADSREIVSDSTFTMAGQHHADKSTFDVDQQLDNFRGGILPAARARLSSLRSLGSKKLTAIKMRLYDTRQKLEEYVPESGGNTFAIMNSPSLTPELLSRDNGSFFTLQNLRSTYLISALHSKSNTLTVHTIDSSLRPLFFYKVPENCHDILISSNILYAIQYIDGSAQSANDTSSPHGMHKCKSNTEKESRDADIEKQDSYAETHIAEGEPNCRKDSVDLENLESETGAFTSEASLSSNGFPASGNLINAVGVISSAMASCAGHEVGNKPEALLALFKFEAETVLCLHQMATYRKSASDQISKDERLKTLTYRDIRSPIDYVQFYSAPNNRENEFSLRQMEIMQSEFPQINYDPCYIITDKNIYFINLKKEPFAIFLDAALANDWKQCREFCNIFDLSFETCIEFAGDVLLRRNKITQALLTYNSARVKPIRTALKLAMFGHTCALMHLCAMALKITYILKSKYLCSPVMRTIFDDITLRHSEDVRKILPKAAKDRLEEGIVNEGEPCSDYTYGVDEAVSNLQMSPSSQFHLANLLLITLAEKAVKDKNYVPLWNFLAINSKYHTNMTSIVLCQSGLYSSALLLAKVRGVWIDTFLALISVVAQEFGWYAEFNICLYNLSEPTFAQILAYVPQVAVEYFGFIQEKMERLRNCVLQRLEKQLNPFSAALRPIVSQTSAERTLYNSNENNVKLFEFCKVLIETYLAVIIHMDSQHHVREKITNSLSTFRITYEDNQFAIESSKFKPISAGCAHCACVLDGIAYFWGSNGVPCNYSANRTSDPPEPPHVVKSLDLLAQLNLEVHTVKCGRQHTLILTNNGLYALGNNFQSQLGVGNQTQVALQPILVEAFDGRNITILEAGQYHNAAVADGLLYTWGWGIYGQLGHGDAENIPMPKLVPFFEFKKILQVSLGHAHSLILCEEANDDATDLYVFGSNHFGQLGIGTSTGTEASISSGNDEIFYTNQTKSSIPIKLKVGASRLRLIHTKFFTNLVVDENEKMYTWGSSPQALRLANQIKRRANAKQKIEENQRRVLSKVVEVNLTQPELATNKEILSSAADNNKDVLNIKESISVSINEESKNKLTCEASASETENLGHSSNTTQHNNDDQVMNCNKKNAFAKDMHIEALGEVIEEIVPLIRPMLSKPLLSAAKESDCKDNLEEKNNETEDPKASTAEEYKDPAEHMSPHLVDTSEIAGRILQLSSGLFHFALISSTCTLYTWGKNLEHQLGTEDKERRAVGKPMPLDNIERPMYVDCGADFTVVMTSDFAVKAFGGNSNGQCGRDLGPSLDKMKQRVVCLPTTKRLMRFESQCVEAPVEINLPRPSIRTSNVRFLKMIPKFQTNFVQEPEILYNDTTNCFQQYSTSSPRYNITSENTATGTESDDMISSLENLSNKDLINCYVKAPLTSGVNSSADSNENSSFELTPEEQSYSRLAQNEEEQNQAMKEKQINQSSPTIVHDNRSLISTLNSGTDDNAEENVTSEKISEKLRQSVHYCLYIFHGLYNPDRVLKFAKERLEYKIRIHMLNFKFVDAFVLCLEDCDTAHKALKIFEYYSKDTSFVPMSRQELKFLIYYLMRHFLDRNLDILKFERFLLADLDFYLLELAYVLYFNNNNTVLERNLCEKFKDFIIQQHNVNNAQHKLEDAVINLIFDRLSIKFKTILCQQLLKLCSNN